MNILHIIPSLGRGGVETWLMHVYRHIDRNRYHFDFLPVSAGGAGYADEVRQLGGKVLSSVLPGRLVAYRRNLMQVLAKEGPYDAIHSHMGYSSGFDLRYAAKASVPIRIAHSHNTKFGGRNRRLRSYVYEPVARRWIRTYATVGIGCSHAAADALFSPNWRSDSRLGVLYCGLDFSPFRVSDGTPQAIREKWGIPDQAPVIGHVGGFRVQKNHQFLLQLATELLRAIPDAFFLFVGDGPLRAQIETDIQRLGLGERVILTGWASDVPSLMHAMDVFVLPSLHEGLGLVLVEAQCAALPCICSDVIPSEADILPGGVRRLPLSSGTAAWSEAICEVLRLPRLDVDEAFEKVAGSPFALERSVADLLTIYDTGRLPGSTRRTARCGMASPR